MSNNALLIDDPVHGPGIIVFYVDTADDPLAMRGRCYCGQPISLERSIRGPHWTFNHAELALISADERMMIANDHCRDQHPEAGTCLLREALIQLHSWETSWETVVSCEVS